MQRGGELDPLDDNGLCLLSLDGGGVRGLSSLYILKGIMARLNHERGLDNLPPVKPCDVFDLIGGTSTGGLIAIMLGRLEMDVDECIIVYSELMKSVFKKKWNSFPISLTGKSRSRFKSEKLESAIKKAIIKHGSKETDLFNDGVDRKCRVFVCTIAHETKDIVRLRSYNLPDKLQIPATISEAALATSAATTFFDPVDIGERKFADGALGANNPVEEVEGEASNIWCPDTADLKPLVKCFVSVGTGNPGKKPIKLKMFKFLSETIVEIATETDNTEKRFIAKWRQHFDEKRYFRFSVDQGLQHIKLTEYQEQGAIEAATDGYLDHQTQGFRVRDCIRNLKLKKNVSTTDISRILAVGAIPSHSIDMLEKARADRLDLKYRCDIWLRPSNMREIYNNHIRERLSGTCDWIWSHPIFSKWSSTSTNPTDADHRLLHIYGTHGCGKTVLASSIVESLRRKGNQVLFFSFSGSDTSRQTLDNLARSLLWQLLQEPVSDESFEIMRDLMSHGQPLTSELWTTFKDITTSMSGPMYWVIDGVDECKESGEELFNQVIDLLTANKDAHAVLLGRTHILQPINQSNHVIEITPSLIKADIDAFINTEMAKSIILQSSEVRDLAFKTLRDGSQGMFLWVKLMVRDLCKSFSRTEVIERLHNLPHGLQKTYRHLFLQLVEELDNIDLRFTKRLLAFVIAARRPLNVKELQYAHALVSRSDSKTSHECSLEDCMPKDIAKKVLRICGIFLQITDGVVSLVHISVKEFLTRPESEWSRDGDHKIIDLRINPEESHYLLVSTCIDYLEIGNYGFPLRDQDESSMPYDVHPFLEYASKNLVYHVNRAGNFSFDVVNKFHQYLMSEASFSWVEYFAVHLVEDGSSGVEAEEFTTWLLNGAEGKFLVRVYTHLRRQIENLEESFGENDRRADLYRMVFDMISDIVNDESNSSMFGHHTFTPSLAIHKDSNDIHRTVPVMTEMFNQNSVLTASKQLDLLIRLQYHIRRAKALTGPLELLFRLILQNASNVPIYALMIIGGFYKRVNQPEKALQVYHNAIMKFGNHEVPMKYAIWSQIGFINYDLGQYQEAEKTYQRVVEGRRKILGQSHPDTLISIQRLGNTFFIQNKYVNAEETFQQAVQGRQKTLGLEHVHTLASMDMLGNAYLDQGKVAEAQQTFQRVVEVQKRKLGLEHPDTLVSLHNLGVVFYATGRFSQAEEIFRHIFKGIEKGFGLEHMITLNTIYGLGKAFEKQEKYVQAKEMYQRATEGREKLLGSSHEDTLQSKDNLEIILEYLEENEWEGEQMRALFG